MNFVSLTDPRDQVPFQEAIFRGVPEDATSLYVPEDMPRLAEDAIKRLREPANLQTIGKTILDPYVGDEYKPTDLDRILDRAITFDTPVTDVGSKKMLELYHGPTMAFKDWAAGMLGSFLSHRYEMTGEKMIILVATSGDTGGAIAHGLGDMPGVIPVILFPKKGVSNLQGEQMRRVAPNVRTLELEDGSFQDCLGFVKRAFEDKELRASTNLSTANSLNIGRLLPQAVYYARMANQLRGESARVVVPTGNVGDITAAAYSHAMGVPGVDQLLIANNRNNAMARYVNEGEYVTEDTHSTLANAMDVADPANKRRLDHVFGGDINRMREIVQAGWVNDEEVVDTIKRVHAETGKIIDPHTAVAWKVSEEVAPRSDKTTDVIVSTASAVKFAEKIYKTTGLEVDDSEEMARLRERPERSTVIESTYKAYRAEIEKVI